MTAQTFFAIADMLEQRLCRFANRGCQRSMIRGFFRAVSRLGDGLFWYTLIALMPFIIGLNRFQDGLVASAHMLCTGAVGFAVYKLLKKKLVRERPFISCDAIKCAMPPLDRYSFPSGHTLHAVLFTSLAIAYVPELTIFLIIFATLVAASRVVLGLHYPSDVLVGAILGWLVARMSWVVIEL
ncbi:MAG: phosphatase PAP2 family protein [Beijerinckiaceae bacterium]|nr:phosphatase PAP2 family protein [Beijerinckiaceae bacterium]